LNEQNDALAAEHFRWLRERGLAPATINHHRSGWFAVWNLACQRKLITQAPSVPKFRVHRDVPDAWTADEAARILEAASRIYPGRTAQGIPIGKLWRAIVLVLWYTGLRRGTLLKLRPADVDLQNGWLTVPAAAMKNRTGKRYKLGPDAIEALADIWDPNRARLFPLRWERAADHFRAVLKLAGIQTSGGSMSMFHRFRRTVATLVAVKKGLHAAMELLGHSSIEVTLRYIDPRFLPGTDFTDCLPPLAPLDVPMSAAKQADDNPVSPQGGLV
jgi:integrase